MAITTLESQRRNSVVLLEARPCNSSPPPAAYVVPHTRRLITCPPRPRWESAQTVRRRRHEAAERAFQSARRGELTPALFTRLSRFPTRTLPPLGVRACNLDAGDPTVFTIGDMVRVRRFKLGQERSSWTEWQRGQVLLYLPMRAFLGNFGHAYVVRAVCPRSGKESVEQYAQFIGEIYPETGPDFDEDPLSSEECAKRRIKANYIYSRIPSTKKISGIAHKDVWTPAQVLTWEDGQDLYVRSLVGPTAGHKFIVKDALPYTLETAVACRREGQNVIGPDGKLFLVDKAIEPLINDLAGPLQASGFTFPSPATFMATPVLRSPSEVTKESSGRPSAPSSNRTSPFLFTTTPLLLPAPRNQ
ncbi:hypothetical protein C8J57DRAFT_1727051 [Mycena rebaudengoi]|nr:hypothetical protein C8J57DRAFT_1727051 [Mycena rebaudengoi]